MIKRIIKYLILKYKWRGKLKFSLSSRISMNSTFEGMNQVHPNAEFHGIMGYGSYISHDSLISGEVGKFCSIAPYVRCNSGRHPYTYPYATTAPCFFSTEMSKQQNGDTFATRQCFNELSYYDDKNKLVVKIGNDCWIGEGAFLIGGVNIHDGAVILAHAVVTKDIPPYAIVGGVPAKIVGYRYNPEDIDFLLKTKWWDNTPEWFENNWELLNNLSKLKQYYKK